MKKISIFMLLAVVVIALAGCSTGVYLPVTGNTNLTQTQVVLSEANFKVVKTVRATVLYKQKFQFDKDLLAQSAYASLLEQADLKGSQALINVNFEQVQRVKGTGKYPRQQNAITVTGVVIEFTK